MVLDNAMLSERFGPEEVSFAKDTAKEATTYTEEDKDQIMHRIVANTIFCFKKDKFASAIRVQGLQYDGGKKRTEKGSP